MRVDRRHAAAILACPGTSRSAPPDGRATCASTELHRRLRAERSLDDQAHAQRSPVRRLHDCSCERHRPSATRRCDGCSGLPTSHRRDSPGTIDAGAYQLRFAWTRADLHAVQRLRYRVFNEELGEGLLDSGHTGRDEDERDPWFHHLMICHRESCAVVGTYQLQTAVMAATRFGFYSATLFELGALPGTIIDGSVEIGRACVAPEQRSGRVLRMLWKGLARYLQWKSKRYLLGCCSLAGTDVESASDA